MRVFLGPYGWFIRLDAPRAAAARAPAARGFGGKEAPKPKPLLTASLRGEGIKASELTLEQALVMLRPIWGDEVRSPVAQLLCSSRQDHISIVACHGWGSADPPDPACCGSDAFCSG